MTIDDTWPMRDRFLDLHCRWFRLMGEHLQDPQGQTLEYWRVEKADTVIILPIYQQQLLLPPPTYRPGVGQATWDFPGGRVAEGHTPATMAPTILQRELGIQPDTIRQLTPINTTGWAVNSSFSNQYLYGFVADLQPTAEISPDAIGKTVATTPAGIAAMLSLLTCLQCRAVILQWWWTLTPHELRGTSSN
ncbi:MAG: NUDIX hydrolase [Cyanobacteria bacterium]|nr:NUDIX hydrolase [Cyanobacteriota bacterium]